MGQLENTVKLGRCTRRRASFVIRLAIASICRPPRFRHQGNPALIVMLLSSDLLHTAVRHPIVIVKAPLPSVHHCSTLGRQAPGHLLRFSNTSLIPPDARLRRAEAMYE